MAAVVTALLTGCPTAEQHNSQTESQIPDSNWSVTVIAGKILRMTPEGGVPTGNPSQGSLTHSYVRGMASQYTTPNNTITQCYPAALLLGSILTLAVDPRPVTR